MYRLELKRLLRSKVFIVTAVIMLAYFIYLNVMSGRMYYSGLEERKQSAQQVNSYLSGISQQSGDGDMLKALRERRTQAWDGFWVLNSELEETPAYIKTENLDGSVVSRLADPVPEEYKDKVEQMQQLSDEAMLLDSIMKVMDYQLNIYPKAMRSTLEKALVLINDPDQDAYTVRLNKKAVDKYNVKREFAFIDSSLAHTWNGTYTFMYDYFYIVLAVVFVFLSAEVFCSARSNRLEGIIYTSKYGRSRLFCMKYLSLATVAFAAVLVFTMSDIFTAYSVMGGQLIMQPIQIMSEYQLSAAGINILSLILICGALRLLMLLFVIALAGAVSSLSRNVFISAVINSVIMFTMFALYVYSSGYMIQGDIGSPEETFDGARFDMFEKLRAFLPACLVQPHVYFEKFDYINIADYPFLRLTTCITVTAAASVLMFAFAYFRFGNVLGILPRSIRRKNKTQLQRSVSQ